MENEKGKRTFYKIRVEKVGNLPPKSGETDGERITNDSKPPEEEADLF